jgi:hypothetical protein
VAETPPGHLSWREIVKLLADSRTEDHDKWLLRTALLERAGVAPTTDALACLAGTTPERANGAMAVLVSEGLAGFETES